MLTPRLSSPALAGVLALLLAHGAAAQAPAAAEPPRDTLRAPSALVPVGSPAEERQRTLHLLGQTDPDGFLLRSFSSRAAPDRDTAHGGPSAGSLAPEVRAWWNSSLPFSFNDGAAWAGRGLSLSAAGGGFVRWGRLSLVLRPEVAYSANEAFQTIAHSELALPRRSRFASPWHGPSASLDLPSRPGDHPLWRLHSGQSSLSLAAGPASFGLSTENLWWGPGIRNALVLSSHAPGFAHAFVRTRDALSTPLGEVEGTWLLGRLRESEHFDEDPDNDTRTLNALGLVLRPAFEPDLSVGLARAVVARLPPGTSPLPAALDVLRPTGRPNSSPADSARGRAADQVTSFFARWVLPASGFEAYLEWARFEEPASLRDLLEAPQHSQGYTLGLQWARPLAASSLLRLQAELTDLEPSPTFRQRPLPGTYASTVVEHGYTHRGEILGASIGPGASSQWAALDYLAPAWEVGGFAGRIRWDEASHLTAIPIPDASNHDVSVFAGLRGGARLGPVEWSGSLTHGVRLSYLFQTRNVSLIDPQGVDVRFTSLSLSLRPAPR